MGREGGIHLVVEHVIDSILDRAVRIDPGHLRVGRLDGQLAAKLVLVVVNHRILEEGDAAALEPGGELAEVFFHVIRLYIALAAIGDTGLCPGGARLVNKNPHTEGIFLLGQKLAQVLPG